MWQFLADLFGVRDWLCLRCGRACPPSRDYCSDYCETRDAEDYRAGWLR